MTEGACFAIPRDAVVPVDRVDVRLDPAPHPFEQTNAAAIAANWEREAAANPALYNGVMMLPSVLRYEDRRLVGRCHAVRYATLLYWRRERDVASAEHFFAHAALVARDGPMVAIRMGRHTANPGRVYFAAGSFEPPDFPDGMVDVDANMVREVAEETGIDISGLRRDPYFHLYSSTGGTVLFRRYWLEEDAATAAARIAAFVAAERDPEIDGPVPIAAADDLGDAVMNHTRAIVRWHFAGGQP